MKTTLPFLHFCLILFCTSYSGFTQGYQPSLDIRVPYIPEIVQMNGKPTVYYELHLLNFSSDSIRLLRLSLRDVVRGTPFLVSEGQELKGRFSRVGMRGGDILLPPGSAGILYLEYAWTDTPPLSQWNHSIEFERIQTRKAGSVQGGQINLTGKPPLRLGAPLEAGPWATIYSPEWGSGHRRVVYTLDGQARIPGRFAIDFMKLDDQGRYTSGEEDSIQRWYGYGANVLAVQDGEIVAIQNDFPESVTLSAHPIYSADKATGNYIALRISQDRIVFYEHLKPGSIRVKAGQHVKKGEMIALVGFTGQTTGPHLHLHVADRLSALGAEGIPFVFEQFTLLGHYPDFNSFGKAPWAPVKTSIPPVIRNERPASTTVIQFTKKQSPK